MQPYENPNEAVKQPLKEPLGLVVERSQRGFEGGLQWRAANVQGLDPFRV